ncbi:hypothetical protein, partial [Magnetospirillum sp. UT-4]|uniref:hypothetical protein n=1 Tax=Magnetospirillum sp. UT-4 TaxID=2681467 RepID=UPI0015736659
KSATEMGKIDQEGKSAAQSEIEKLKKDIDEQNKKIGQLIGQIGPTKKDKSAPPCYVNEPNTRTAAYFLITEKIENGNFFVRITNSYTQSLSSLNIDQSMLSFLKKAKPHAFNDMPSLSHKMHSFSSGPCKLVLTVPTRSKIDEEFLRNYFDIAYYDVPKRDRTVN